MKKAKLLICILLCTFIFSSCGGEKKELPNDRYIQFGEKVIEIVDQYADYDITAEEAYEKLEKLRKREDELTDAEPGTKDYFDGAQMTSFVLNISLDFNVLGFQPSSERMNTLIENRNALAAFIGAEER